MRWLRGAWGWFVDWLMPRYLHPNECSHSAPMQLGWEGWTEYCSDCDSYFLDFSQLQPDA